MKPIRIVLSPTHSRPLNIFLGTVLTLAALLVLLALATYSPSDPSWNTASSLVKPHNWIGLCGAWLGDLLLQGLGVSAFFLPLWMGGLGWTWMRSRPGGSAWLRWIGSVLALAFVPAIFALLPWRWLWLGALPVEGVVGKLMAGLLVTYLNLQGAWLVAGVLSAAGLYFATAVSFWAVKEGVGDRWMQASRLHDRWRSWREDRAELKEESLAQHDLENLPPSSGAPSIADLLPEEDSAEPFEENTSFFARLFHRHREPRIDPQDIPAYQRTIPPAANAAPAAGEQAAPLSIWERSVATPLPEQPAAIPVTIPVTSPATASAAAAPAELRLVEPRNREPRPDEARLGINRFEPAAGRPAFAPANVPIPSAAPVAAAAMGAVATAIPAAAAVAGAIAIHERVETQARPAEAQARPAAQAPLATPSSGFKLPPTTLLNPSTGPQAIREDELRDEARVLVEKCAEFDVRGQVVQINPGPMVTTYEFKPEAGVKYSRVTGLADDLCLAMRAESILIERIPGKNTVGIQVPNRRREVISLRDCLEAEEFSKAKSRLTLAMGKDINGRNRIADLAGMPHVLIAGSTGSGKSVAINAMIMSLLYRTTPTQVRLILVDPKRVELGMYAGIPHLFTPIITEAKLAANALRNAVREMERRLKLLASRSVRNIDHYNKLFEGATPSLFDDDDEQPLPYIVIIIDELADLMLLDRANVEESITRLAQMSRAVGIHLILATQRPSVDIITGLIKANIPTRISFRLTSKVDSRTILDTNGAESLLGRGDMLFLPPGTSRPIRLHAPYVSEKEVTEVVEFWKAQGQAEYVEGFLESPQEEKAAVDGSDPNSDDNDPLFDDAVRLVFEFGKASTSLLQRRLRIGYGRAAHLVDLMENDGLIGPADGSRPRELLKAPGWLHEVASTVSE
jgi:S-DNA-T family DNA segregation ATPase FtsK/SpoIIIE